jgi:FkbH-like protein
MIGDQPAPAFPVPASAELAGLRTLRNALWQPSTTLPQIFNAAQRVISANTLKAWPGPTQRIAVVGSLTTDLVAKAVICAVFREDVLPVVYGGLYGAYVQEVLDPASGLHAFKPDIVVIVPDWRDAVTELPVDASSDQIDRAIESKVDLFAQLWASTRRAGRIVLQHVIVPPTHSYRGVAERLSPAGERAQIERLNDVLFESGRGEVTWIDTAALASALGTARWAPSRFYHSGKLPFDPQHLAQYMRLFGGAWRAAHARTKKVLVLDLDNTLWGGVIGDDGIANIELGPGTAAGEAFVEWATYVKHLGERGVILAVCSKNDAQTAMSAFDHPYSVLKATDFAAFEASWDDKVAGLHRIAAKLNLGIDTFVFADDNPAECALVRDALPAVGVVELGMDPAAFIERLEAEHWFELQQYTREDAQRVASYGARARAETARAESADIGSFLSSLQMVGAFYTAREGDLARIAQLELKTNQFNVTTRRYNEAAIRVFASREDVTLMGFTLRDKFGDHGVVSTLITVREGSALRIDSWLMSCRVFSRTAEEFIMRKLVATARAQGADTIVGEYLQTEKNVVVANLYARLGFTPKNDASRWWALDVHGRASVPALETYVAEEPD